MPGKPLFKPRSQRWLIDQIPNDGCLIIFNGNHHSWRARASELEVLHVNQFDVRKPGEGKGPEICDVYISWREDNG